MNPFNTITDNRQPILNNQIQNMCSTPHMQHKPTQHKRTSIKLIQKKSYHDIISTTIINSYYGQLPINVPL